MKRLTCLRALLWCLDDFPSSRAWMHETHMPVAQLFAELPNASRVAVVDDDVQDGSMAADAWATPS